MTDHHFNWDDRRFKAAVRHATMEGLVAAADVLHKSMQRTLSVKGTKYLRSKPGEPPRRQTGKLRRSVQVQVERAKGVALVGSTDPVGKWMEKGTARVAARPWIWPSYYAAKAAMARAFAVKAKAAYLAKLGVK